MVYNFDLVVFVGVLPQYVTMYHGRKRSLNNIPRHANLKNFIFVLYSEDLSPVIFAEFSGEVFHFELTLFYFF